MDPRRLTSSQQCDARPGSLCKLPEPFEIACLAIIGYEYSNLIPLYVRRKPTKEIGTHIINSPCLENLMLILMKPMNGTSIFIPYGTLLWLHIFIEYYSLPSAAAAIVFAE